MTSRKRYDKFKLEFKDVFDEVYEKEGKNENRAQELRDKFEKEAMESN